MKCLSFLRNGGWLHLLKFTPARKRNQKTPGTSMRIFVSSTVFDLLDVRAEIAELLRELGIAPVMSDDKLSDFDVKQDVNSIETCLLNVESSDEVILILDQRYGPRLGNCGFDDISATHLEYRRAVQKRRPIHVFVRDRLDADHAIWKKNKRNASVALSWVQNDRDRGLLELIDEHSKLVATAPVTNWYTRFSTSVDLKACLRKYLKERILQERLVEAIQRNEFPLFDIDVDVQHQIINSVGSLAFHMTIRNVGGAPAFNFQIYWADKKDVKETKEMAIVAPGNSISMFFAYGLTATLRCPEQRLIAEYESPIGVSVRDVFQIGGRVLPGPSPAIIGGGSLVERRFKRSPPITLSIEE